MPEGLRAAGDKEGPMLDPQPPPGPAAGRWRWRLVAALLILGVAGLRLAYLACACPLDLAPDEAHYWDWSRHLDWSYYSKGPLVAYLIRAGCALAGPLSLRLTGDEMLAVRLPAVLCGALLLVSVFVLTVQIFRDERLAAAAVALALPLPLIAAGSSLMTIDAPYTCCWGWALVLGHRAIFRGSAWAWPAAGLVVGLGTLAKYTMVLWPASLGLFLLADPARRRLLLRPGFWVMAAVAAACCVPILVWNVRHDWVSLRHVGGQAGLHDRGGLRWLGPLSFVAAQAGVLLGFWFVAWLSAMTAHRPWRDGDAGRRYLWWLSAPVFAVFLLFSLKTAGEPNWPVTAYLSGLVLAAGWLARQLRSARPWERRLTAGCLAAACVLGLTVNVLMHYSALARPWLIALSGPATAERPLPLRRLDPTCRLRGFRWLAAQVDRVRDGLRAEGIEPVLAGSGWTLPGELAFYCAGHPAVFSFGLALGDRHSQYDLWRPNPVWDPQWFTGCTVVFVGEPHPMVNEAFARVDRSEVLTYREGGQPIARWTVTVCRGFHGFRYGPGTVEALARW
jgi:4-amino-4-deoxy-L-arabinose transferase-like glycosyltransferase